MRITRIILLLSCAISGWAQSFSITAPTASQSVSGTSFKATVAISGYPSAVAVRWIINGRAASPDSAAQLVGYSRLESIPDGSWSFNTHDIGNGTEHHIQAQLLDAKQSVLAAAAADPGVQFTVLNTNQVNSQITVIWGTSPSSSWSGTVTATASFTGSPASLTVECFIAGVPIGAYSTVPGCIFPTAAWDNGTYPVVIRALATNVVGQATLFAVDWQNVAFANANTHSALRINSQNAYVSPTGTLQLATPIVHNADGSTTSVTTVSYFSDNHAAATVNSSGLVSGVGFGLAHLLAVSTNPSIVNAQNGFGYTNNQIQMALPGATCPANLPMSPYPMIVGSEVVSVTSNCFSNGQVFVLRGQYGTSATSHPSTDIDIIGYSRDLYAYVSTDNAILNWTTAGTIVSNWAPNSIWLSSAFTGGTGYFDPAWEPNVPNAVMAPLLNKAFNAMEFDIFGDGCAVGINSAGGGGKDCSSFPAFQTSIASWLTKVAGYLHAGGANLYNHVSLNAQLIDHTSLYRSVINPGGTWASPAASYALQAWRNSGLAIGAWGLDEVAFPYGPTPTPQVTINSAGPFSQIVGSGGICTVSWTKSSVPTQYNNTFLIFGATTHSVLNSTIGGAFYTATAIGSDSFTFPCSMNDTANASSDPALRIEPFAHEWQNSNTDYVPYTVFTKLSTQTAAVSPKIPFTNPPPGGAMPSDAYPWMGDPTVSDFARPYLFCPGDPLVAARMSVYSVVGSCFGPQLRQTWNNLQSNRLLMPLTTGFTNTYFPSSDVAVPVSGVSCTNDLCTFPVDHGVRNILPGVTRMILSGMSNSYYNADWIIDGAPTSTTLRISRRFPNTSSSTCDTNAGGCSGLAVTMHFSDGSTYAWNTFGKIGIDSGTQAANYFNFGSPSPSCSILNKRGLNFTLTATGGSLPSYLASDTFKYAAESPNCSNPGGNAIWREVPTGQSGTGATAVLIPDNNFLNGRTSAAGTNPSRFGPRVVFSHEMEAAVAGASSIVNWPPGSNPAAYNSDGTPWNLQGCNSSNPVFRISECSGSRFAGGHPVWEDGTGALSTWNALVTAQILLSSPHVSKCLFQPRAAAPDLGFGIETTVRTGSNNNCLMALNQTDLDRSVTVDMTAFQTGQPMLLFVSSWSGTQFTALSATTATNNVTVPAGGVALWIAPVTADPAMQPTIAARLADVNGAAEIAVEYSCSNYAFTKQIEQLPLIADAGTGSVTLPVDKGTCGTVTYRLRYLGSNGILLATSDTQTL